MTIHLSVFDVALAAALLVVAYVLVVVAVASTVRELPRAAAAAVVTGLAAFAVVYVVLAGLWTVFH